MSDIPYNQIENVLNKISNRVPIIILDAFKDKRTVYLDHFGNGAWWCVNPGQTDIKLWPSNSIQIISIGGKMCQSKQNYKDEKETYTEY